MDFQTAFKYIFVHFFVLRFQLKGKTHTIFTEILFYLYIFLQHDIFCDFKISKY